MKIVSTLRFMRREIGVMCDTPVACGVLDSVDVPPYRAGLCDVGHDLG
jgi:hypothetical protein